MIAVTKMKDSRVAWIGNIPASWEMRKVSRSFSLISSGTTPSVADLTFHEEGTIPWVNTGDLNDDIVTMTAKKLTEQAVVKHSTLRIYSPGTLLVAMYGATIGKVGILGIDACTNQACCALSGPKYFDTRFIYFWFLDNRRNLVALSNGGGQPNINQDLIRSLRVQAPSVAEQRRISRYLDEEMGKVDRLLALRLRQMELLREQRAALIQKVVTRGLDPQVTLKDSGFPWLGEIPDHWRVERNKVIFREIDLRSSDGSEELLTVSHITGVTPRAQKEEVNMFLAESNEGYKRVEIGDLAINTMWAWMGALGFSKYPGIVSPSYNVYQFRQPADPDYFELLFRSPNFIKEIKRFSTGVWESRLRLYPKAFFEIRSPIPPLEEQKEIVEHVKQITRQTNAILSAYSRQLELLTEYRAALIHECVTGQRAVPALGKGETP